MSAAAAPDPDERRDGHDHRPSENCALSDRDRRILGDITAHESGSDPVFVAALRGRRRPVGPTVERVLQILSVAAVALVVVPGYWSPIVFLTTTLVGVVVFAAWFRAASVWDENAPEHRRRR